MESERLPDRFAIVRAFDPLLDASAIAADET
jgi:hypothetical protein